MAIEVPARRGRQELDTPQRTPSDREKAAMLFRNEDAYGSALYVAARTVLPIDEEENVDPLQDFDPKTIRLELQDAFNIPLLDRDVFGRLMAAITIAHTDLFYQDLPSFIEICNVLSGTPPVVGVFDPADAWEVAWGVAESQLLSGEDEEFSEEIRAYMGEMLAMEGFFSPPKLLKMALVPQRALPTDIEEDSELAPAMVGGEEQRQADLHAMLVENTRDLVAQLESVVGPLTKEKAS